MSKYKVCEVYVVSLLLSFLYVRGVVSNSESAAQSMGEADVRCLPHSSVAGKMFSLS